mmetsp:Transcript_109119/g.250286  ORF Transcript_109119/g.250286 Transcript_109119/m.250286 type:complete len:306 (-) Transcript_109119:1438-2355(-)
MVERSSGGVCEPHRDSWCTAGQQGCAAEDPVAVCLRMRTTAQDLATSLVAPPDAFERVNPYPLQRACEMRQTATHVTASGCLARSREKQLEQGNCPHRSHLPMRPPHARIQRATGVCAGSDSHRPTARKLSGAWQLTRQTGTARRGAHWAQRLRFRKTTRLRSSPLSVLQHLLRRPARPSHPLKPHTQRARHRPAVANPLLSDPGRWTPSRPDTPPTTSATPFALLPPRAARQQPLRSEAQHQSPAVPSPRPDSALAAQRAPVHHSHAFSAPPRAAPAVQLQQCSDCGPQPPPALRPVLPVHDTL